CDAPLQRVARSDRLQPAQLFDAWRADTLGPADQAVNQQPHVGRGGVPATRDQAAVDRGARLLRIRVHRLWVVRTGKSYDAGACKFVTAELDALAGRVDKVLEIANGRIVG